MATPYIHGTVLDLLDQLRGALRFRWAALAIAWVVAVLLWIGVFFIPNTYEATARVFVDPQTTLSQATQGIGLSDDIAGQLLRVREALLGVPQLEKVAEETNLFVGALTPEAKQAVIERMLKDIKITGGLAPNRPGAAVFTITYDNHERAKALQVVDRLLNSFVEGALGGKRQGSEQALKFLEAQIAEYGTKLSDAESRLAEFKKQNIGLMPKDQVDYFTQLQKETDDLRKAQETLNLDLREQDALKRQLQSGQPFIAGTSATANADSAVAPTDTETQIEKTQQQIDELLLRYTDNYPDVIALRQTLKELQARQKREIAAARRGDPTAAARVGLAANPVYQKVEEQYNALQVTIAAAQQDLDDRRRRIAILRGRLGSAPAVEAQLAQLTRNYDVTRKQYNELLARLDSARLGQQAAATGTVKFEVIDPPTAEYQPVKPNRPLLIVVALIAAIAAGVGSAYGLHLFRPVFVSTRQLAAVTGLNVLGAVGLAWRERDRTEQRRGNAIFAGGIVALVVLGISIAFINAQISQLIRGFFA